MAVLAMFHLLCRSFLDLRPPGTSVRYEYMGKQRQNAEWLLLTQASHPGLSLTEAILLHG